MMNAVSVYARSTIQSVVSEPLISAASRRLITRRHDPDSAVGVAA